MVDEEEVNFVVLLYLESRFPEAARRLKEQLEEGNKLLKGVNFAGQSVVYSTEQLKKLYPHMDASYLGNCLEYLTDLKPNGDFYSLCAQKFLPDVYHNTNNKAYFQHAKMLKDPRSCRNMLPKFLACQTGLPQLTYPSIIKDLAFISEKFEYQRAIRGHRAVIYTMAATSDNKFLITGSDDRLVKIWCLFSGALLTVCPGHTGEIQDVKVNCNDSLVASACSDKTIRVWILKGTNEAEELGDVKCTLRHHTEVVTMVSFHPKIPTALISTSFDGSCILWNVDAPNVPYVLNIVQVQNPIIQITDNENNINSSNGQESGMHLRRRGRAGAGGNQGANEVTHHYPTRQALAAQNQDENNNDEQQQQQQQQNANQNNSNNNNTNNVNDRRNSLAEHTNALFSCVIDPSGKYFMAGGKESKIYVWKWDWDFDFRMQCWPRPEYQHDIVGHAGDILIIEFSRSGKSFATACTDGTVRMFTYEQVCGRLLRGVHEWQGKHILPCPNDEEAARQARLRRKPLGDPVVHQLAWSADDTLLVMSVSDNSIRVYDTMCGKERHRLKYHKGAIHTLKCHPHESRLLFSASYDGDLVFWDLFTGLKLRVFNSKQTKPKEKSWTEELPLIDGVVCEQGDKIIMSDAAGQFHIYALGPQPYLKMVPYDQFFYEEQQLMEGVLVMDERGILMNEINQQPVRLQRKNCTLCDLTFSCYPQPFQEKFQTGDLINSQYVNFCQYLPHSLITDPPTAQAASWKVYIQNGSEEEVMAAFNRTRQREMQSALQELQNANAEDVDQSMVDMLQQYGEAVGLRNLNILNNFDNLNLAPEPRQVTPVNERRVVVEAVDMLEDDSSDDENGDNDYVEVLDDEEEDDDDNQQDSIGPEFVDEEYEDEDGQLLLINRTPRQRTNRRQNTNGNRRRNARRIEVRDAENSDIEDDEYGSRTIRRIRRTRQRREDDDFITINSDEEDQPQNDEQSEQDEFDIVDDEDAEDMKNSWNDNNSDEENANNSHQNNHRNKHNSRKRRRQSTEEEVDQINSDHNSNQNRAKRRRKAPNKWWQHNDDTNTKNMSNKGTNDGQSRDNLCYEWLSLCQTYPSVYIPQIGDEVVYLKFAHEKCLAMQLYVSELEAPWQQNVRNTRYNQAAGRSNCMFRAAEPCKITELSYHIAEDQHGWTLARVYMQMTDENNTCLYGKQVVLDVPPPWAGHAEYLVLRQRYEDAVQVSERFHIGSQVWTCYPGDGKYDIVNGKVYEATIVEDKVEDEFVSELYEKEDLWERYGIRWNSTDQDDHQAGPSNPSPDDYLSPWELFSQTQSYEKALEISRHRPRLNRELQIIYYKVKLVVEQLLYNEEYVIFHQTPEPLAHYWSGALREMQYYNKVIPLPLSLENINQRLQNRYYRTVDAIGHDAKTVFQNAKNFNGTDTQETRTARNLYQQILQAAGLNDPDVQNEEVNDNSSIQDDEEEDVEISDDEDLNSNHDLHIDHPSSSRENRHPEEFENTQTSKKNGRHRRKQTALNRSDDTMVEIQHHHKQQHQQQHQQQQQQTNGRYSLRQRQRDRQAAILEQIADSEDEILRNNRSRVGGGDSQDEVQHTPPPAPKTRGRRLEGLVSEDEGGHTPRGIDVDSEEEMVHTPTPVLRDRLRGGRHRHDVIVEVGYNEHDVDDVGGSGSTGRGQRKRYKNRREDYEYLSPFEIEQESEEELGRMQTRQRQRSSVVERPVRIRRRSTRLLDD